MAQFVKVTSIDDLQHLYPNLQVDHTDGIQCMLQDDQITQYTDGQGQQVIATIDQTGMQLPQNIGSPTQIVPQHQQIVVHQPTQYIIQQMDPNDHPTVHYIQQSHQPSENKDGITEDQLLEQNIGSVTTSVSAQNNPLQQYIVKSQNDSQFVSHIQPIIHQPIQIHQEVQAVDVGGNILVLQSPEKQEFIRPSIVQKEIISNQKEKLTNQAFQKQHQKSPEKIQNLENTSHVIQQQINQNCQTSPSGKQEEKIQHPQQQIIQQLQCYNKITVIEDPFQSNLGIASPNKPNENLSRHYQTIQQPQIIQQQQFRPQKKVESVNTVQQSQHVLIPQLSSSPNTTRILHQRQRGQQESETSAPLLILQKLDGPLFIRQPQIKNCLQGSTGGSEKIIKTAAVQVKGRPYDGNVGNTEKNQEFIYSVPQISQSTEVEQKVDLIGAQSPINKYSTDKQQSGELKVAVVEQVAKNAIVDQGNKTKMSSKVLTIAPQTKIKTTDQQTESVSISDNYRVEKFTTSNQMQIQTSSSLASQPNQIHLQFSSASQNPISIAGRQIDNDAKKFVKAQPLKRGPFAQGGQNIQVQNSTPSISNAEKGDLSKNLKFTCGVISPRMGSSTTEINQKLPPRQGVPQTVQQNSSNKETNLPSNENAEEATMLVILLNGERKRIKIPCSQQNILLGQILQQAGISSSPTNISVEQNVEDPNSEQVVIKTSAPGNQTSTSKSPVVAQFIPNFIATPRGFFATVQQQRLRSPVPRLTQTSNLGIVRQRLQISSPRLSNSVSPQQVITSTGLSSEVLSLHPQLQQNITSTSSPAKEEMPRYVPGFMAICPFCGIQSVDFNKCVRCKRKLPENVKCQSISNIRKKKTEKAENEKIGCEKKLEHEEKQFDSSTAEVKEKIFLQLHDKKKQKGSLKKKKISDEPTEILILSSDDEEEDHNLKKTDSNKESLLVFNKEPVYLNSQLSDTEMNNILKESSLSEDLMKNVQPGYFTTLQCRNIRIGSYKVQPKERVFVSSKGIKLIINSLKNENSIIMIPLSNILKVLIHFGRQIPVIFIYPLPQVGAQIRSILGMDDKMGPYYDPASTEEESHKRITLLLEKITEDNKITLHKIFEPDKLELLSEKEANEILLRASPLENRSISANRSQENIRKIMVYPPPPEKGGITLNNQDYACLGEDQFLNDVIIDFYLKYLLLKVLSPEDRNRTHVFSTFFYKRLTTKPKTMRKNDPENDPKLSPAEKRHMRVKGWTKQVNLFEKDFIIVPINEHSHWFLAIICFPGLTGPVRFSDNKPIEIEETVPKKNSQTLQIGETTITHIMKPDGSTVSLEMDSGSDRDEAEGDQDDLHPSSDDEESESAEAESNSSAPLVQIPLLTPLSQNQSSIKDQKLKILKKKPLKEPIKQPCILIFDSLAGASRVRVVATLRDYLKIEYKKKMGEDRDFTRDTIKGAVPKVPQQNNFTDCGLYVLQYVESFFQDPLHDFKLPLKYLQEWFPEEVVSSKRQKLARLIRTLMEEQGIKVEEFGLPVLTFTNENTAADCNCEEEDDEDEEEMNEEGEEMLKSRVNDSDLENDDEDDMDLGEDEEMVEDEEEELEIGNFQGHWLGRIKNSKNKLEHSIEDNSAILKNCSLVDYDSSDSEEEECLSSPQTSLTLSRDQASSPSETVEETEYCLSARPTLDNEKSVPLTELQDFESQISCTTIEKTYDCKNTDYEIASVGRKYKVMSNEEETSLENTDVCNPLKVNLSCNEAVESRHFPVGLPKGIRSAVVLDINKKLVKEKTISPSLADGEESEESSFLFKSNLDSKLYLTQNCDKSDESKKVCTTFMPLKNNSACKRTYHALKSIRIPKKTERNLEVPGKRQKIDET